MPKNIVVFSDGTGQEGGKTHNTNIYKLFNMAEDRTSRQIAFYDRGVGVGLRKLSAATGRGISKNICECYRFIFDHYEDGDRIYLLGFSRGAATVRSLSSFIHYFGLLPKSRPELIEQAYKIYQIKDDDKRKKRADAFIKKHHNMWVKVHFLGCFDTVAALGFPVKAVSTLLDSLPFFKHQFHNYTLSDSVDNAYHALALDEARKTFHPLLWNPETREGQRLSQVWFCGVHTDVGGGYQEQQLSDIPLVWMTQKALDHGLLIYPHHQVKIKENIQGVMHNSREGLASLFKKEQRNWHKRYGTPVIHASVAQRALNQSNGERPEYQSWIKAHQPEVEPWHKYNGNFQ